MVPTLMLTIIMVNECQKFYSVYFGKICYFATFHERKKMLNIKMVLHDGKLFYLMMLTTCHDSGKVLT